MVQEASESIALVWLRNDLRLTDHEPLSQACRSNPRLLVPVYCLDPALLKHRGDQPELEGVPVMGPHRSRFLLEALICLEGRFTKHGSGLHYVLGSPEEEVPALLQVLATLGSSLDVYHYSGIGSQALNEERSVKSKCEAAAKRLAMECRFHVTFGHTLYPPEAVLAAVSREYRTQPGGNVANSSTSATSAEFAAVPPIMTNFRKAVEQHAKVPDPLPAPSVFPPYPSSLLSQSRLPASTEELYSNAGALDSLAGLEALTGCPTVSSSERDPRSAFPFKGGELAGRRRLQRFLYGSEANAADGTSRSCQEDTRCDQTSEPCGGTDPDGESVAPIHHFKDSRMMASGVDNSAKLSAYLASGCLSSRMVHSEVTHAKERHGSDTGHSCLIMHLTIRDFFLYTALKEGDRLERSQGLSNSSREWRFNRGDFERWCRGQTGFPFVDACMRELAATGYMSNRGRQNAANFFSKAMGHDWRLGAAIFESLLLDHDWAVNTCNWAYNAGVGNDPRDRIFRTVSQGMMYDPHATLIRAWIPKLKDLSDDKAHQPWSVNREDVATNNRIVGAQGATLGLYPLPLLEPSTQIAVNHGKRNVA